MIDEKMTKIKFGYTSNKWSENSHKKIVCICDNCGNEREIEIRQYHSLCHKCSHNTPKILEQNRIRKLKWHRDNQDKIKMVGKKISIALKKHYAEMDDPVQEIIIHHYIYDFNDWDKYTIPVTRSEHHKIHDNLRRAGLEILHINIMKGD